MTAPLNPVNWFEIPVTDIVKARRFYEAILGVELTPSEMGPMKMAWFPMSQEGQGAAGTLAQGEGYTPSTAGTLVYFRVADIDATLAKVAENGGKTLMPKMGVGEHGFVAHFQDCEGNRVALHAIR